eukprot:832027-Rhodomonas_salina.3
MQSSRRMPSTAHSELRPTLKAPVGMRVTTSPCAMRSCIIVCGQGSACGSRTGSWGSRQSVRASELQCSVNGRLGEARENENAEYGKR